MEPVDEEDGDEEENEQWMDMGAMNPEGAEDPALQSFGWDWHVAWDTPRLQYTPEQMAEMSRWVVNTKQAMEGQAIQSELPPVDLNLLYTNDMQWAAYRTVEKHWTTLQASRRDAIPPPSPLRLLISGTAGTGKTFLIRALSQLLGDHCIRTATTGMAAILIAGMTIHSAAALPIAGRARTQGDLRGERLNKLQSTFRDKDYLILDEMSMIGQTSFGHLDNRLREATGAKDDVFGGLSIILVGDFGQLAPVGDLPLYVPAGRSHVAQIGRAAYVQIKDVIFLTQVERQGGDSPEQQQWRATLGRIHDGEGTLEDWNLLRSRQPHRVSNLEDWEEAPRLWFARADVNKYNYYKLKELGSPVVKIEARHGGGRRAEIATEDKAHGLQKEMFLAVGAKVFLTWNLWQQANLVNGMNGVVVDLVFDENSLPPALPVAVMVDFPNYIGPPFLPDHPTYVPISPQYAEWMEGPRPLSRTQIPLRLSWAFTIYKSQGQTIRKAMIYLGNREQQSGATFVALSRLRRLEDGIIEQFPFEHLEAMRRHRNLQARRREEARLQALAEITLCSLQGVDDGAGPSSRP